jgi:hypothetical protein
LNQNEPLGQFAEKKTLFRRVFFLAMFVGGISFVKVELSCLSEEGFERNVTF